MVQVAATFAPILSPLHRVIARRRVRTVLRVALACALAGLAALLVLMIAERVGVGSFDPLPILLVVGSVAALFSSLLARMSRRSPVEEAFFIDRANGFGQAYGTAVELAQSSASLSNPVTTELMATVGAGLDRISTTRLVRIFTPGFLAALVLVVALGASVWLLQRMPALPEIAAEDTLSAPADVATLTTVAEMLAEDAEIREAPLLEAIARTLADRASAAAGEPITDQIQRQINDLLDQAATAYGEDAPSWLGASDGSRLFEIEDALAAMDPADAPGAAPQLELAIDPYAVQPDESPSWDAPSLYDTSAELAGQPGNDEVADGGGTTSETAPGLEGTAPGQGPRLMQSDELRSIGATPIGAALDSGRGVSDAAGLGSEDFRPDNDFTRLGFRPTEDMVVSAEPRTEGSRVRIEIIPETVEDGDSGAANAISGQTVDGSDEPVARDLIPATARDITARYFARTAQ